MATPARRPRARPAVLALLLAALLPAAPAAAQHTEAPGLPSRHEPDARVVIGPFAWILAVAGDGWSVHAATPAGLLSYDVIGRRWLLPLTVEDGYPAAERPTALAAPRGERAVVLGTALGTLWRIDTDARRVDRLATVPGPVQELVAGEQGNLHVRTPRGWFILPPGAIFPDPAGPPPRSARPPADPRLDALGARIGLDARMRRWAVTGTAPGARPDEWYVGTAGGGLLRVDALTHEVDPLPYGLAAEGVGSILVDGADVWIAGDGTTRDGANLAHADSTLARWSWPGTMSDLLPRGFVRASTRHRGALWFAASDGLFRHDPARRSWERLDTRDGLPGNRATSLFAIDSVLWIGTDRGACAWLGDACGPTLLPGTRITAIAQCGGALWIGTDRGLFQAPAAGAAGQPGGAPSTGALPQRVADPDLAAAPIPALACLHAGPAADTPGSDTPAAATPESVYFGGAGEWRREPQAGARGRIRALAAHDGVLWVGADAGVARRGAAAGDWTYYTAPEDVPLAPVSALTVTDRHLWLATPGGAVRLELRPGR